ncbi:MAG: Hsp20/alpha crystallin family protein [Anaerohalosphaeraceae bacterium]
MALMELVPWRTGRRNLSVRGSELDNPFVALQRQMSRLFDDFFSDFGLQPWKGWTGFDGGFYPRMDVAETDKEITITAELPGIDQKDIEISLTDGVLTLKGEKKQSSEEKKEGYYHSERSFGAFSRSVALPVEVDENKVEATYKDGVLKIRLPKTENQKARAKKIEVKAG